MSEDHIRTPAHHSIRFGVADASGRIGCVGRCRYKFILFTRIEEEILRGLIDVARKEGLEEVVEMILADDTEMQRLGEKLGFNLERDMKEGNVWAELEVKQ
jgi:hypothetical protein